MLGQSPVAGENQSHKRESTDLSESHGEEGMVSNSKRRILFEEEEEEEEDGKCARTSSLKLTASPISLIAAHNELFEMRNSA
jgi:hypothetical protein